MIFEEIKTMILDRYEPDEVVNILIDSGISDEDILDNLEELIMMNPDLFTCPEEANPFENDDPEAKGNWVYEDVETEGDWD